MSGKLENTKHELEIIGLKCFDENTNNRDNSGWTTFSL